MIEIITKNISLWHFIRILTCSFNS